MMAHYITWKGLDEVGTLECCEIDSNKDIIKVNSVITGSIDNVLFNASYLIKTDNQWRTTDLHLSYDLNDRLHILNFSSDARGNWLKDGEEEPLLKGCIDIDITATPFTNTLAVNRLKLAIGERRKIKVLYVDVLENTVTATEQIYTRINEHTYHFATGDFEAEILFDEFGFVVDYPGLFERV